MLNGLGKACLSLSFCYFAKLFNFSFFYGFTNCIHSKVTDFQKDIIFSFFFFFYYLGRRNCICLLVPNMILFFLKLAFYPLIPKGNLNMLFRVPC